MPAQGPQALQAQSAWQVQLAAALALVADVLSHDFGAAARLAGSASAGDDGEADNVTLQCELVSVPGDWAEPLLGGSSDRGDNGLQLPPGSLAQMLLRVYAVLREEAGRGAGDAGSVATAQLRAAHHVRQRAMQAARRAMVSLAAVRREVYGCERTQAKALRTLLVPVGEE